MCQLQTLLRMCPQFFLKFFLSGDRVLRETLSNSKDPWLLLLFISFWNISSDAKIMNNLILPNKQTISEIRSTVLLINGLVCLCNGFIQLAWSVCFSLSFAPSSDCWSHSATLSCHGAAGRLQCTVVWLGQWAGESGTGHRISSSSIVLQTLHSYSLLFSNCCQKRVVPEQWSGILI